MKERIGELDALRGLAALYVLVFHLTMNRPEFHNIFNGGITGVDLFFMISGFVIFLTLNKTTNIKTFIISRFTRLYPTYWACVTITFIALLIGTHSFSSFNKSYLVNYLGNMTMLQYYFNIRDLDGSYWTMIVELLFYAFMALLFITKQLSRINLIGYLFLSFCFIYSTILGNFYPVAHSLIHKWFPLANYFPLFFSGILFYKMKYEKPGKSLFIGLLACACVQLTLFNEGGIRLLFVSFNQYTYLIVLYFALFWLFVKGYLQFITVKPLLFLGTISYSIYLLHQAISKKFLMPMFYEKLGMNMIASFILSFVVIITLATLITFLVEKPSTTILKRKLEQMLGVRKEAK